MATKTASLWGRPPSRYYNLLRRARDVPIASSHDFDLAVLGCADGKFVLPAARAGMRVLAVDVDEVALFGGKKAEAGGTVVIPGLQKRLEVEGLQDKVVISCVNFADLEPSSCRAVLTSGAIQYSFNMPRSAEFLLSRVMGFVGEPGLLYIDYMLPYEAKYRGRPNCPPAEWWRQWCRRLNDGWLMVYNRILPPTLDRAHVEYPVDHFHQWGHLLLQRLERTIGTPWRGSAT